MYHSADTTTNDHHFGFKTNDIVCLLLNGHKLLFCKLLVEQYYNIQFKDYKWNIAYIFNKITQYDTYRMFIKFEAMKVHGTVSSLKLLHYTNKIDQILNRYDYHYLIYLHHLRELH